MIKVALGLGHLGTRLCTALIIEHLVTKFLTCEEFILGFGEAHLKPLLSIVAHRNSLSFICADFAQDLR